ncbi:hypothetical protein N431DRAFT_435729 [Stipitochalara longipes BDJ]|nr:hypothetical protein N431DRAFT_435729 [Stipitochalara longipes BDJ]
MTSGLFEGMSDTDIHSITSYTSAKIAQSAHPLFFPTMFLDILTNLYIQHRKKLEHELFVLEEPTGISRGRRETSAWDWDYDLYRETITHCNQIYTGLVYLERRLDFTVRLSDFILGSLKFCEDQRVCYDQTSIPQEAKFDRIGKQIEETVRNARNFASSQLHQTMCLQKRSQALTTVVSNTKSSFLCQVKLDERLWKRIDICILQIYTIITQQDSRTNVKIAKAAKVDSTSMTAIAFLGIIFLPAMLVAVRLSLPLLQRTLTHQTTVNVQHADVQLLLRVHLLFRLHLPVKQSCQQTLPTVLGSDDPSHARHLNDMEVLDVAKSRQG